VLLGVIVGVTVGVVVGVLVGVGVGVGVGVSVRVGVGQVGHSPLLHPPVFTIFSPSGVIVEPSPVFVTTVTQRVLIGPILNNKRRTVPT